MTDNPLKAFGAYGAATAPPLGAQQLQAIRNEAAAAVRAAVDEMQLRKWAVEQAFTLAGQPHISFPDSDAPIGMAKAIYDFVSLAAVVKVDIGQ